MRLFKKLMLAVIFLATGIGLIGYSGGKNSETPPVKGKFEVVSNSVRVYENMDLKKHVAVVIIVLKNTDTKNLLVDVGDLVLENGDKNYDVSIQGMPQIVRPGEKIYYYNCYTDGDYYGVDKTMTIDGETTFNANLSPKLTQTNKQLDDLKLDDVRFIYDDGNSFNIYLKASITNQTNKKIEARFYVVLYN